MSSAPSQEPNAPESEPHPDSRRAHRHHIVRFVWYCVLPEKDEPKDPSLEGVCRTCDISLTGIGLYLAGPIPTGRTVLVELAMGSCNISAVGRTVHVVVQPDGLYRVGIRFLAIAPNHQLNLEALLSNDTER